MVSLGIPLPVDPPAEDWTPLSRATWSQLKALFGVDAPRAAGEPPREEVILVHSSSRTELEVTPSPAPFSATVPSSGSSVVTQVGDSRACVECRYPVLCPLEGRGSRGSRTLPVPREPAVGSRAGCDSTGKRLLEAGVEPNPGPREDFQLRPELLEWVSSTTGWPRPAVDGFAVTHNALCTVFGVRPRMPSPNFGSVSFPCG